MKTFLYCSILSVIFERRNSLKYGLVISPFIWYFFSSVLVPASNDFRSQFKQLNIHLSLFLALNKNIILRQLCKFQDCWKLVDKHATELNFKKPNVSWPSQGCGGGGISLWNISPWNQPNLPVIYPVNKPGHCRQNCWFQSFHVLG